MIQTRLKCEFEIKGLSTSCIFPADMRCRCKHATLTRYRRCNPACVSSACRMLNRSAARHMCETSGQRSESSPIRRRWWNNRTSPTTDIPGESNAIYPTVPRPRCLETKSRALHESHHLAHKTHIYSITSDGCTSLNFYQMLGVRNVRNINIVCNTFRYRFVFAGGLISQF